MKTKSQRLQPGNESSRPESGGKHAALQTLREDRSLWMLAAVSGVRWLQRRFEHRFPTAGRFKRTTLSPRKTGAGRVTPCAPLTFLPTPGTHEVPRPARGGSWRTNRFGCASSVFCACLLFGSTAPAAIPEPDNILYGNITLDNTLVTAARTDVIIEARRQTNGPAIASYRMGGDTTLGNFYALRLKIESVTPLADANASQISDNLFIVVTDASGMRAETTYLVTERGVARRVDFGATPMDSDGDGLPDAWELQQFTNLAQSPGSINANGMTALQNFIAGTDPNDANSGFRLVIARTNNQNRVSFQAVRAEGPGYDGMTRFYTLESNPVLTGGSWNGVPSYTNIAGDNQMVDYVTSFGGGPTFFRGEITLQGFALPLAGDSDGDGLPDSWESLNFGNLNQNAGSENMNGQTALQNYVAGNDPNNSNDLFKLSVTANGANRTVSFFAVQAQGTGYEGKQRYYALETSSNLASGWASVGGYSNVLGNDQTLVYQAPSTSSPAFYRSRVWLQP